MGERDFSIAGLGKEIVDEAGLERLEQLADSTAEDLGLDDAEFRVLVVGLAKAFNQGVLFASSEIYAQIHEAGATVRFLNSPVPPSDEGQSSGC